MFEKVRAMMKQLDVEAVPFDPSSLGDELALRTDWGPAKGGGASYRTHQLVTSPRRAEFKPTGGSRLFGFAFIGLGVVLAVTFVILVGSGAFGGINPVIPLSISVGGGAMMLAAGVGFLWFMSAPIVFDKSRGEYWKGRTSPADVTHPDELDDYAKLEHVRALQIISERCKTDDGSFLSYELNLVLDHGERLNVVDHGSLADMRRDAAQLAEFLGVPVWDATA